jgi:hypothetical protein
MKRAMARRKKNTAKRNRSQLISFMPGSYLDRTSRPIYALAFLAGFIIFYELGTLLINPEALQRSLTLLKGRVVTFLWIQGLLEYIGFTRQMTWIATPLVVVVILLALQITSRTSWRVRYKDFIPMSVECTVMAVPLVVLSLMFNSRSAEPPPPARPIAVVQAVATLPPVSVVASVPSAAATAATELRPSKFDSLLTDIVTAIGAGIYEELVFRLMLLILLMMVFQDLFNFSDSQAIVFSIVISAVLFSLHHHWMFIDGRFQAGEPYALVPFVFRTLAGIYFAVLYAVRGFGITAGAHAFYDIIAALIKAYVINGQA